MESFKVLGPVVILILIALLKITQRNIRELEPYAFQEDPISLEEKGRSKEKYERATFWEGGLAFFIFLGILIWLIALMS